LQEKSLIADDKYLFDQIRLGNKSEFDKLFRAYYQDLCRFAVYMSSSPDDAEEIVQDIFFKIWTNHKILNISTSAKSYLFTAVKNSVYNIHKHNKIKEKFITNTDKNETYQDASVELEHNEGLNKIEKTIDELPEKRKQVFTMSKIEGYKYKEIADKLNISIKTVENHMGEALKFLRNNLEKYEFVIFLILLDLITKNSFILGVFSNLVVN
jgi:RNA polymerase sigma-70 factor (ECF subfamily)